MTYCLRCTWKLWYHMWYHMWYHVWYRFTRFLGHDVVCEMRLKHMISPLILYAIMTQETGKSISHMTSWCTSRDKQHDITIMWCTRLISRDKLLWYDHYVIYWLMSYVMWPGWRRAGAGCAHHGPPPPLASSACLDAPIGVIGLVASLAAGIVNGHGSSSSWQGVCAAGCGHNQ